jgi:hypothetical protein
MSHRKRDHDFSSLLLVAATAFLAVLAPSPASAQRKKHDEPHIDYVFPAGAQRGTTVEAVIGGQSLQGAQTVRVNGHGVTGSVTKAVDDKTVNVAITVAPDAELGEREIRLMSPGGASNHFRFLVGQIPEIKEIEPNSEKSKAQKLDSLPVLINGQIMQGDLDIYRFAAKAGQKLVIQADARKILPFIADAVPGWNDTCLTLYDAGGKQLASVDDFRFKPDPVLFFDVPKDGEYLVEIRDIIYRGRADFVYRLSIGTLPYVTHIYPLGGRRNTTANVQLFGVNLPSRTLDLALPGDSPVVRYVDVKQGNMVSNALPFAVGDYPEVEEKEPNDKFSEAMRVPVPVTINGRINRPDDEDHFVFSAKAGQQLVLEVFARRLDSPLDSILTLFDSKEKELAENDDTVDVGQPLVTHHADSRLVFKVPADGDYTVRLRDVQGKGGPEYAYRLTIAPVRPDFTLHLSPDNPQVGRGDTAMLTVSAVRKDGFDGRIKLAAHDLPPGFTVSDAAIEPGKSETYMMLTAPADAPLGLSSPTVTGEAAIDGQTITRQALPGEEQMQAFSFRVTVPTQEMLLAVAEAPAFTLSVNVPAGQKVLEIPQGGEVQVTVKVTRKPPPPPQQKPETKDADKGKKKPPAKEEPMPRIFLTATNPPPPPGVSIKTAFIPPDQDQATVTITAAPGARPDVVQNLVITGAATVKGQAMTRFAPPIPLKVLAAPKAAK